MTPDVADFLQLAHPTDLFLRQDDVNNTPLVKTLHQFVSANSQALRSPTLAHNLGVQAARAAWSYNPPRVTQSLQRKLMERLSDCLNTVRESWKGTRPSDRLQKLDASKEFYRLWGILQFAFCISTDSNPDMKGFELFGDGFFWGGCTIVYLFEQQLRFDAFNFTDHVLNISVFDEDGKDKMGEFLQVATEVRLLNDRIFNTLRTIYPVNEAPVEHFEPPETEDFTRVKIVSSVDTSPNYSEYSDRRSSISYRKHQSQQFGNTPIGSQQSAPQNTSSQFSAPPSSGGPPPPPPPGPPPGPPPQMGGGPPPPPPPPPPPM
jgi:hypothetical protein